MKFQVNDSAKFDNHAKDYQHITAVPLAAAMGAEIQGVAAADLSDAAFAEVEDALYRHKMIYFRDQKLSFADHEAFTRRLGEFAEDAYTVGVPGHEQVQPVIKEADATRKMYFGAGWHTDSAFLDEPPSISTLYGVEVPPYGGDTIWANCALAYSMLSDRMRGLIDDLNVHMSARDVTQTASQFNDPLAPGMRERSDEELEQRITGNYHPLVRTHPVTGERSLYVDETYSCGIEGMTDAESAPILEFLVRHITQSAFTCRLRWAPGTFAMWDNRLCLHQGYNDYDGFRREMYRTTVRGERPVRAAA